MDGKFIDDEKIVELFWQRSESAIEHAQNKYGKYCYSIAYNILSSEFDAEECVNDTYIRAWQIIPPHKPNKLATFLGKITRNISINRYIRDNAQKRSARAEVILDEVQEFIPASNSENSISDEIALKDAINGFLSSLSKKNRMIFVRRYWYLSSVKEIADDYSMSESNVKVNLLRTRNKFKEYLQKEGITV